MRRPKDGWHKILGNDVYVENGLIVRGMFKDQPTHPYRLEKSGIWTSAGKITIAAFEAGYRRETIDMR